ncbi:hypothetical protein SANTM175S_00209 [Streptomyces antimycoticus]
MPAEVIKRRLPSMHHQFKELADVDITAEPMEVGPTRHYVMGGVDVYPDTAAATGVPGLFAAGEVAGGMHGSNRLGGNSLSDLLVFGRRAGLHAARYAQETAASGTRPVPDETQLDSAAAEALRPFSAEAGEPDESAGPAGPPENPYTLHQELQQSMNDLVGIIRKAGEMEEALHRLASLRVRARRAGVEGHRQFNPGLASGDRSAQHAAGQRVRGPVPRWSGPRAVAGTPATTARRWTAAGGGSIWSAGSPTRRAGWRRPTPDTGRSGWSGAKCRPSGPICSTCSRRTSW